VKSTPPVPARWPEGSLGHEAQRLRRRFAEAGVEDAGSDAHALLCWALNCNRSYLLSHAEDPIPPGARAALSEAALRRENREPLAYIVGEREFWSLPFRAAPGCLIPRPETELLVERAAALLGDAESPRIFDLCTGSGAIGVALAKELPGARIVAADISETALRLARENARRNGVESRFEAVRSNLFEGLPDERLFDALLSNPPYIASGRIGGLMPEVARFEPREALDGGPDGMCLLRRIIIGAPSRLKRGGLLILEMDPEQILPCRDQMRLSCAFGEPRIRRDLACRERVIETETV